MSNNNPHTSYQGFSKGMIVARKGRQCEITKIHFETNPPSVTVLMKDNDCEVGTEFDRIQKINSWSCSICPAQNGNELLKCHFCGISRNFRENISTFDSQERGQQQQQEKENPTTQANNTSEASDSESSATPEQPSPHLDQTQRQHVSNENQQEEEEEEEEEDNEDSEVHEDNELSAESDSHLPTAIPQFKPRPRASAIPSVKARRAPPAPLRRQNRRPRSDPMFEPFFAYQPQPRMSQAPKRARSHRSPHHSSFSPFGWPARSRSLFGFDGW